MGVRGESPNQRTVATATLATAYALPGNSTPFCIPVTFRDRESSR